MKNLRKLISPDIIIDRGAELTEEFLQNNGRTSPWRNVEIKDALIKETSSKCAYCESEMLAVSFGEIEHIRPKSKYPHLVLDWGNLTLVCSKCNNEKRDKYFEELSFVNPYEDDVAEHIFAGGAYLYSSTERGEITIREIKLNDGARLIARDRAINALEQLVRRRDASAGESRVLSEELIEECLNGPYSSTLSAYLKIRSNRNLQSRT